MAHTLTRKQNKKHDLAHSQCVRPITLDGAHFAGELHGLGGPGSGHHVLDRATGAWVLWLPQPFFYACEFDLPSGLQYIGGKVATDTVSASCRIRATGEPRRASRSAGSILHSMEPQPEVTCSIPDG